MHAPTPTPMMAQYLALKAEAGDCLLFYRMGDFFELFFDDARTAAVLDIALTSRGEHDGAPIPMCGVPVHAAEGYLARLIKAGCRVAIAEQVESPEEAKKRGGSKALVARDIVRFVTAGTLTEEALLEPARPTAAPRCARCAAVSASPPCDISTGRMELSRERPSLGAALARLGASETGRARGEPRTARPQRRLRPRRDFASDNGEARLQAMHGVATLDGFGAVQPRRCWRRRADWSPISTMSRRARCRFLLPLALASDRRGDGDGRGDAREPRDPQHRQGGARGSLIEAVDRCVTGAGARQLAEDSRRAADGAAPDRGAARSGAVALRRSAAARGLRGALRRLPDIGRALGRVVAGRGSPRDLGQLRDGLSERAAARRTTRSASRPARAARRTAAPRCAATAR